MYFPGKNQKVNLTVSEVLCGCKLAVKRKPVEAECSAASFLFNSYVLLFLEY